MEINGQKQRDLGTPAACLIGALVWWFLSSQPSEFALLLVAVSLVSLFLLYCFLSLRLPGPDGESRKEHLSPLPQSESNRPKSLTH